MSDTAALAVGSPAKEAALTFLTELVVVLCAALVCGALARRVGLPKMVGEIAAGALLGPTVLGAWWPDVQRALFPPIGTGSEMVYGLGQLAVVMLVGVAGMHVDLGMLGRRVRAIAAIGTLGLAVPLVAGVVVGLLVPVPLRPESVGQLTFASFLGIAMAVSAIPVIARILMDLGMAAHDIAQVILAAAIVDDLVGWVLLSVVTGVASNGTGTSTLVMSSGAALAMFAVLSISALPGVRRYLVARCARWSVSVSTTAAVTVIIVFAVAGQSAGFEPVIGAFFGGIVVATATAAGSRAHEPLRAMVIAFFSPVFFVTVGLRLDVTELLGLSTAILTAVICVVAVVTKFAGAGLGAKIGGYSGREAWAIGAGLNVRGVIQIVIATTALQCGVFGPEVFTALVVTTIVTVAIAGPVLERAIPRSESVMPVDTRSGTKEVGDHV